jgi:hypothetical protein
MIISMCVNKTTINNISLIKDTVTADKQYNKVDAS